MRERYRAANESWFGRQWPKPRCCLRPAQNLRATQSNMLLWRAEWNQHALNVPLTRKVSPVLAAAASQSLQRILDPQAPA